MPFKCLCIIYIGKAITAINGSNVFYVFKCFTKLCKWENDIE